MLVALLSLSCWCIVVVVWIFLVVPWVCLQCVIVVFPNRSHLLFFSSFIKLIKFENTMLMFLCVFASYLTGA